MRRPAAAAAILLACAFARTDRASAQGPAGADWMTTAGDAQRSAWVRRDAKISRETVGRFQLLWKLKLENEPRQLNALKPPSTLERLIGYRGFRMLGFVAGSSDAVFTIDTDLGRMEWTRRLTSGAAPQSGSLACPGGMTTSVTRPTLAAFPAFFGGPGGAGRGTPAKSGVGEPGMGAVTLAQVRPSPPPPPAGAPTGRPNPAAPPGGQFGRGPFLVYALSSDGMLHSMHLSNGTDFAPPVRFLPPNANAHGLIVVDSVAYAATEGGCGGAPNGVWALDLGSKEVATWRADVAGSAGPAFDGEGTLYVTTRAGGDSPSRLVALAPRTLDVKGWYEAGGQEFSSSPVLFEHKGKTLIAAATRDGRIHLLDAADLGGADHRTPLFATPALPAAADAAPGSLASWRDATGTRWVLAAIAGGLSADAGFTSRGAVTNGAVVAWKLAERDGAPALQPAWASRDLRSPLPPTIINGVVFATSSGEFRTGDAKVPAAQRARRSSPAVLYALDGQTGEELWTSGAAIASFTRGDALSGGVGQVYLATHDGTLYAFGFPMEH